MEFVILIAVILAVVGAFSLGGHVVLEAYKDGLEVNLQLRTKEPDKVEIPAKHTGIDITKLFAREEQTENLSAGSTNRTELMDEWLNGPKESR